MRDLPKKDFLFSGRANGGRLLIILLNSDSGSCFNFKNVFGLHETEKERSWEIQGYLVCTSFKEKRGAQEGGRGGTPISPAPPLSYLVVVSKQRTTRQPGQSGDIRSGCVGFPMKREGEMRGLKQRKLQGYLGQSDPCKNPRKIQGKNKNNQQQPKNS